MFAVLNILIGHRMRRPPAQRDVFVLQARHPRPQVDRFYVVLDYYGSARIPKEGLGFPAIRAGSSTSTPPRCPHPMRFKLSSPSLRAAPAGAACFVPSSTSKALSATLPITTPARNHSSGAPNPVPSLLRQAAGTKRQSRSIRRAAGRKYPRRSNRVE